MLANLHGSEGLSDPEGASNTRSSDEKSSSNGEMSTSRKGHSADDRADEQGGAGDRDADVPSVVGIGASAGGISALQDFFEALPSDTGLSFAVILHLDPTRKSQLDELLQAKTEMPVRQVQETVPIEPNCVYVIPPDKRLEVGKEALSVSDFEEPRGRRLPIDHFFRSLAKNHGDGGAIVLSGTGSDGAVGIKDIKEEGGLILAQDPDEAKYGSMPQAAIATGLVDQVLPVGEMAVRLPELKRLSTELPGDPAHLSQQEEKNLQQALAHVCREVGHDFSDYKRSTILRRLKRRMQVNRVKRIEDYFSLLQGTDGEAEALFREILIGVTNFFRDPNSFEALQETVIPKLFAEKDTGDAVRLWVTGCATGEEAYSVAMLLEEYAATLSRAPEIQVFASDLDEQGLEKAREGRYPRSIEADVSAERLDRFFQAEDGYYRVKRSLRDRIIFASHSVLHDPPFSNVDLVTCRNLLIYLQKRAQEQGFKLFHYALRPGGFLFLGQAETADRSELFQSVDSDHGFYQSRERTGEIPELPSVSKVTTGVPDLSATGGDFSDRAASGLEGETARRTGGASSVVGGEEAADPESSDTGLGGTGDDSTEEELHRTALEASAPPSVLVDEQYNAVHLSKRAGRYMEPSEGIPTAEITELIRPELQEELYWALYDAFEEGTATVARPVEVQFNGRPRLLYLTVRPTESADGEPLALVLFNEGEDVSETAVGEDDADADDPSGEGEDRPADGPQTKRQLREELKRTRKRLRESRQKYESSREELTAQNEELRSINEEYKAATEELETSKEELEATNEELQVVNSELEEKLEEVSRANSDLQNLMAATEVGTLFLDRDLLVKRFTPQTQKYLSVRESDQGRPIGELAHGLDYDALEADARQVLESLEPIEREVQSTGDDPDEDSKEWYLIRLRPYRTVDDEIDGVVVSFVDVTDLKQAEKELREAKEYAELIVDTVREGLLILEEDLRVRSASASFYQSFPVSPEETEGQLIYEVGGGQWDIPALRTLLESVFPDGQTAEGESFEDFEVTAEFEGMGERTLLLNARRLKGRREVLLAIEDITDRRKAMRELEERTEQVRSLASRLTMAEQRERERIASLLHDDLQQRLYGNTLQISSVQEEAKNAGHEQLANRVQKVEKEVKQIIEDMRRLSVGLSPPLLESEGLSAALKWLESYMEETVGLTVDFTAEGELAIAKEMRVLLYQITKELLYNVTEHADTDRATVHLTEDAGDLVIEVIDEGCGFDPAEIEEQQSGGGFGLTAARERVRLFGGELTIHSAVGEGTEVTVRVPRNAGPDALSGHLAEGARTNGEES